MYVVKSPFLYAKRPRLNLKDEKPSFTVYLETLHLSPLYSIHSGVDGVHGGYGGYGDCGLHVTLVYGVHTDNSDSKEIYHSKTNLNSKSNQNQRKNAHPAKKPKSKIMRLGKRQN
jgi:hypothetical protein